MKKFLILLCVVFSCACQADWKPLYRQAIVVDAFQTSSIRLSEGRFVDLNPIYKDMGSGEAFFAVLGVGYLGERCIESIKSKTTRDIVGWLVTLGEWFCVSRNASVGVPLISVRY